MATLATMLQRLEIKSLLEPTDAWSIRFMVRAVRVPEIDPKLLRQLGIYGQSSKADVGRLAYRPRRALAQLIRFIALGILWSYSVILRNTVRCAGRSIMTLHRALMQVVLGTTQLSRSIRFAYADFTLPRRRVEAFGFVAMSA